MSVDGVEEISQWGPEKAFLVKPDPEKLLSLRLSLDDVMNAVEKGCGIAGGGFSKTPEGDLIVRSIGYYISIEDIENISIQSLDGTIIKLKDIAKIEEGEVPNRRGAFTLNGEEVQGNIILKRVNTNTQELVAKLKERIEEVKNTA